MGRRRIDAHGLHLRPSRIWWTRGTDRQANRRKVGTMWKTVAILCSHRSMVRPANSSLVRGIPGPGLTYRR
jgi:hypothetical protein